MAPTSLLRLTLVLACLLPGRTPACTAGDALAEFVATTYGPRIAFDVLRNGKPVGEHVTEFRHDSRGLEVESRMQLGISIAFIKIYEFAYRSRSLWCGQQLLALEATTSDGGDVTTTTARLESGSLVVTNADREQRGSAGLLASEHWNPRVLQHSAVLNTITGQINTVSIGACEGPSALVTARVPGARCYQYRGDLEARAWYDDRGRWVGLAFAGRDGSEIVYVCRDCGEGSRAL